MKKRMGMAIAALAVGVLVGCNPAQTGPGPGQKKVHIEINPKPGSPGGKVSCTLKVGDPTHAGLMTQSFDLTPPGSKEFFAGPSEYDLIMMPWSSRTMDLTITVDGTKLERGGGVVMDDDKGEAMFELKADAKK